MLRKYKSFRSYRYARARMTRHNMRGYRLARVFRGKFVNKYRGGLGQIYYKRY